MRPSLSSLVRQILLRESSMSAADEEVVVKPAVLKPQQPQDAARLIRQSRRAFPSRDEEDHEAATEKQISKDKRAIELARKSYAQVDRSGWREKALRAFSFIDKHNDVADVVVIPVAMADLAHDSVSLGGINRAAVVGADQAKAMFGQLGIPAHTLGPSDITIIPVVGGSVLPLTGGSLPTPWMTVHAIFDNLTLNEDMPECSRVLEEVYERIGTKLSLGLLINCSWGENSHTIAQSVATHMKPFRDAVQRRKTEGESPLSVANNLLDRIPHPKLGRRLDPSKTIVPGERIESFNQEFKNASAYLYRPKTDVAAEIMTIAVVKPEELQPRFDLIPSLPEWVLYKDFIAGEWPAIGRPSDETFFQQIESIRAQIKEDMEALQREVAGLRNKFVADLRGKAVFVLVQ